MTAREIAELFEQLELHLIASLKRNLMRHKRQEQYEGGIAGVPEQWEAWQSAKLRDIRRFRRENQQILGQYSSTIGTETEALLWEQYAEGGSEGFFHTSDERLRSLIHEMQNNEARVERAALRYMNDVYRKTILRTATAMSSGGMTFQQATDEATKDFLAQGINCVVYANGRRVNIASYAEMALRTCSTRAMLLGEGKQREKLGIDTVLVSQYGACSDTCLPWQGRVYIDDVFQPYYGDPGGSFGISRNGRQYMRLSIAIQGGLFHPNCRHTISTWIEGISTMPEPMGIAEIERVNKLEKQQRALERKVRKAKRQAAGLTDETARKEAKARVRKAQEELREFIKEHKDVLRRDYWRERDTKVPTDWGTSEKPVEISEKPVTMEKSTDISGEIRVNHVTRLDIEKYKCVTDDIVTDEVVITDERIQHIKDRHPNDYERFSNYISEAVRNPDYILEDKRPATALVLKSIEENGEYFRLALRLVTSKDNPEYKNSVITFLKIREKEWRRLLKNKNILYKAE